MKKGIKYICAIGILVSTSLSLTGNIAHANIRNRILNFFRSIYSRYRRENLDENIKNIRVASGLESQANQLSRNRITLGLDVNKFDVEGVKDIKTNRYYLQRLKYDIDGNENGKVTLVSINKPKIKEIKYDVVLVKYKDRSGKENTIYHSGLPIWVKGKDILEKKEE